MAKTVKSLIRISMMMRNLGPLTNYTMTRPFSRISAYYSSSNSNNESLISARPYLVDNAALEVVDSKLLREALEQSRSATQLLNIVKSNEKSMSAEDAVTALSTLMKLSKIGPEKAETICEKPGFLTLCEILKKKIRNLDAERCVTSLKAMVFFNIPTTSIIVQMILQMLRNSMPDLCLKGLSFLDFLLDKCENTPLVKALKIALPIVYETHLSAKLDRENIISIRDALSFMSKKSTNTETFNILIDALLNCKQRMDPLVAQSLLWSCCDIRCYPNDLPQALNHIQSILAQNVNHLDRQVIIMLLSMIERRVNAREQYFYHEGFVDACASTAISADWGVRDALRLLTRLVALGHTQISLLDYIAAKCFEDPALLQTLWPRSINNLVAGFASADYKPAFWDVIQATVTSDRLLESEAKNISHLARLTLNLLALDVYCPKLLKATFEQCATKHVRLGSQRRRITVLYQAVKTLYPQYSGPWPFDEHEVLDYTYRIHDFPLLAALEGALGGPAYVITELRSKLGHVIDHAIVMRKGGYPVALNNDSTKTEGNAVMQLEELKPPTDSQVILVLYVPPYAYSINTQRMKAPWSLEIKSLEALSGYTVIPIRSSMWSTLSNSEQIPYLMQAIRLKCDELSVSANS